MVEQVKLSKPIVDVMRQRRLCWFGHIERREDNSWLKVQILAVEMALVDMVDPVKPGNM